MCSNVDLSSQVLEFFAGFELATPEQIVPRFDEQSSFTSSWILADSAVIPVVMSHLVSCSTCHLSSHYSTQVVPQLKSPLFTLTTSRSSPMFPKSQKTRI